MDARPDGDGALRFSLARDVDLVAVSPGPRPAGHGRLPALVRLVDLATAGELAEIATSPLDPPAGPAPDPRALDGLIARAEARLVETRAAGS